MRNHIFTLIALLMFFSFNAYPTKWRVNNTAGIDAHFTSFKAAHDGAAAGDTLMFEGSNLLYGDKDTLRKQLVIVGPGYFLDENDMTNDNILPAQLNWLYVDAQAKGSVIMGMSFTGSFDCLQIDADDIIVERNYVKGRITLCYEKPIKNLVVSKNYCTDIGTRWGTAELIATGALVTNNIVTSNISFNTYTTATITNNCVGASLNASNSVVKNNISSYLSEYSGTVYQYNLVHNDAPAGVGNISNVSVSEVYVSGDTSTDGAWALSESSKAKGVGEGGIDAGAFAGNDPYILSGYPPFPVIFNSEIPSTGTYNLLIKLDARSQK